VTIRERHLGVCVNYCVHIRDRSIDRRSSGAEQRFVFCTQCTKPVRIQTTGFHAAADLLAGSNALSRCDAIWFDSSLQQQQSNRRLLPTLPLLACFQAISACALLTISASTPKHELARHCYTVRTCVCFVVNLSSLYTVVFIDYLQITAWLSNSMSQRLPATFW